MRVKKVKKVMKVKEVHFHYFHYVQYFLYLTPVRLDILTLFPGMFQGPLTESILARAQDEGLLEIHLHDIRVFSLGNYKQVDDTPYGGGAGMVLRVDVMVPAIEAITGTKDTGLRTKDGTSSPSPKSIVPSPYRILLSARGKTLTQAKVEELSQHPGLLLVCGHYEGVDERVLTGGLID